MNQIQIAYHESGHAVADIHFGSVLHSVSIIPTKSYGGITRHTYHSREGRVLEYFRNEYFHKKERKPVFELSALLNNRKMFQPAARNMIIMCLAGWVAEKRYNKGADINGSSKDFQMATEYAKLAYRIPKKYFDAQGNYDIQGFILKKFMPMAEKFVGEHWMEISYVALMLYAEKSLIGNDINKLYAALGYNMPEFAISKN